MTRMPGQCQCLKNDARPTKDNNLFEEFVKCHSGAPESFLLAARQRTSENGCSTHGMSMKTSNITRKSGTDKKEMLWKRQVA